MSLLTHKYVKKSAIEVTGMSPYRQLSKRVWDVSHEFFCGVFSAPIITTAEMLMAV